MEKTSDGGEKVVGGFGLVVGAVEIVGGGTRPGFFRLDGIEQGEPLREVVVAQAPRGFLDVRLDVEDGVAVFGVAGAGHLGEVLDDGVPFAEDDRGQELSFKFGVEGAAAGEVAAIEEGDGEFEIVGVDALGFFQGAGDGAGAEADVPHGLSTSADLIAPGGLDFLVGAEEEDIDVGAGKELAATETAGGDEGDVVLRRDGRDVLPKLAEQGADDLGAAANDRGAVAVALEALTQLGGVVLIATAETRESERLSDHDEAFRVQRSGSHRALWQTCTPTRKQNRRVARERRVHQI